MVIGPWPERYKWLFHRSSRFRDICFYKAIQRNAKNMAALRGLCTKKNTIMINLTGLARNYLGWNLYMYNLCHEWNHWTRSLLVVACWGAWCLCLPHYQEEEEDQGLRISVIAHHLNKSGWAQGCGLCLLGIKCWWCISKHCQNSTDELAGCTFCECDNEERDRRGPRASGFVSVLIQEWHNNI